MTKIKNNKFIITLLIVFAFLLAQNSFFISFLGSNYYLPIYADSSATSQGRHVGTLSSTISNNNFNTTSSGSSSTTSSYFTGSTSVKTPSSWTKDKKDSYSSNLRIGVIDISSTNDYDTEKFGIARTEKQQIYTESKQQETEHNVLMINSTNSTTTFGYESADFSLSANSYYSITISYYTNNSAIASIYLKNSDEFLTDENSRFVELQTNGTWKTVTYWIETSTTETLSNLSLYLCLGAVACNNYDMAQSCQGFVLFDNIIVKQYSAMAYTSYKNEAQKNINENKELSFNHDIVTEGSYGYVTNGSFEDNLTGWNIKDKTQTGSARYDVVDLTVFEASEYGINETFNPGTNFSSTNNKNALLISSTDKTGTITLESDNFSLEIQKIYRISVWAKGNIKSGSINITLSATNPNYVEDDEDDTSTSKTLSTSFTTISTKENLYSNNWNEYVFYVTGNPLYDCSDVTISLGITDAIGYILFDDIKTQVISSSDKTSGSSTDSNAQSLNLFSEESRTVINGNFNTTDTTDKQQTYPKAVASWTKTSSELTNDISGIVNTKNQYFNAYKENFGNPVNPKTPSWQSVIEDDTNNVLMMYNTYSAASYQTYTTSDTISLTGSKYYFFTVNVYTSSDTTGLGGANVAITTSDGIIIQQFKNIKTNGKWEKLEIYVYTGTETLDVNVSLGFGNESKTVAGHAFFDNCEITESDSTTFESQTNTEYKKVIDMANSPLSAYDDKTDNTNSLYNPLYWSLDVVEDSAKDSVRGGILTGKNQSAFFGGEDINLQSTSDNVLVLQATDDSYATYTYAFPVSFNSGNYYKVSVDVKTVGLSQQIKNENYDELGNLIPYGASVYIEGFDEKFTGINTATDKTDANAPFLDNTNVFKTYTFYINPDTSISGSIVFALGYENALTSGWAFFENLKIETIDEDAFTNETSIYENTELPENIISISKTSTEDEETDNGSIFGSSVDWYAIPTVIIALAVLIAVVGVIVKRYGKTKTTKVKVSVSYDRSETLLKDMDHRHRKTAINHRLKLLYEELDMTMETLRQEKAEHNKQMQAYQTAQEIAAQDSSVQLEEPDSKYLNFDEVVEQLEKNIAGIKSDIKVLEQEKQQILQKEQQRREKSSNNTITSTKIKRK